MKVYEIITNRIIEKLEAGIIPWHKPWHSVEGMPKNLITKKEYRGINVFLLGMQRYESPYWLSFKQAQELGAYSGANRPLIPFQIGHPIRNKPGHPFEELSDAG